MQFVEPDKMTWNSITSLKLFRPFFAGQCYQIGRLRWHDFSIENLSQQDYKFRLTNAAVLLFVILFLFSCLIVQIEIKLVKCKISNYSARRLIGSRIIESAAYCNHIMLVPLYLNSTQNSSVNWIIRLLLSLLS